MSARLRLERAVRTRYGARASAGHHEVRAAPATTPAQHPLRTRLDVSPTPWTSTHEDVWGTRVTVVEVEVPHEELSVVSTSVVLVDRPAAAPPGGSWARVRAGDDVNAEHLAPHPASQAPPELAEAARAQVFDGAGPDDVALAVCALVASRVSWDGRGVPPAAGTADAAAATAAAWGTGRGGAGDVAHLAVGALHAAGIPARCVVGLAHPDGAAALPGEVAAVDLHAWVEWWSGAWYGWDVVRGAAPGDGHVAIGAARATTDVPVLRGVVAGLPPDVGVGPVTESSATLTRLV